MGCNFGTEQCSFNDDPMFNFSKLVTPNDRLISIWKHIPWGTVNAVYVKSFDGKKAAGNRSLSAMESFGLIVLKEFEALPSDEDVVVNVRRTPIMQWFLGKTEYDPNLRYAACDLTRARQRFPLGAMRFITDVANHVVAPDPLPDDLEHYGESVYVAGKQSTDTGNKAAGEESETEGSSENDAVPANMGKIILDATACPQYITFPTDAKLCNNCRVNLERVIDIMNKDGHFWDEKPRTYRRNLRKAWNSYSKKRKKTTDDHRNIISDLLTAIRRDLGYINEAHESNPVEFMLLFGKPSNKKYLQLLETIKTVYEQQNGMFISGQHTCENRIVSLSEPWVRPIVRGKESAPVEFGAKIEVSVIDHVARIEKFSWDAFNEGITLQASVEAYRERYGCYPKTVLADKIFRTRDNIAYCKSHGIHLNGPRLGRPSQDPEKLQAELRLEYEESSERAEIERYFGVCKRRHSLGLVTCRTQETSETQIAMDVFVQNIEVQIRREEQEQRAARKLAKRKEKNARVAS